MPISLWTLKMGKAHLAIASAKLALSGLSLEQVSSRPWCLLEGAPGLASFMFLSSHLFSLSVFFQLTLFFIPLGPGFSLDDCPGRY